LLDEGSFRELDTFVTHRATEFGLADKKFLTDGVVTGYGTIEQRLVYVYARILPCWAAAWGGRMPIRLLNCKTWPEKWRAIIGLNDSGGARIQEGVSSLEGYSEIFLRNTISSGVIPQICCILGRVQRRGLLPAIMDFVIMTKDTSYMFVTGPDVVKSVTHEEVTSEQLGGAITTPKSAGGPSRRRK